MTHFVVAGAGIGGLTTALALAQQGATVSLIERAPALHEIGAGVQLSPNATRILERLGVLNPLDGVSLEPIGIRVRHARSGNPLAFMSLEHARRQWRAPFLVTHRATLQSVLAEAVAKLPGVTIHLNTSLAGFGTTETSVRATARQGGITRTFDGDACIGADGIRSIVRARLADGDDDPQETGRTAWRALIPADSLDASFRRPEINLWLGRDAHLVHYPLDDGRHVNVVAITREPSRSPSDLWSSDGDPTLIAKRFGRWTETIRTLIAAAPAWTTWPLYDRKPLGAWHAGRVALLGDAAHPILPFLAQGSAQAIEDAAALATAHASESDIQRAFAAYSRHRMARVSRIQQASRQLGRLYHLSGIEGGVRDFGIRALGGHRLLMRYDWLYSG